MYIIIHLSIFFLLNNKGYVKIYEILKKNPFLKKVQ